MACMNRGAYPLELKNLGRLKERTRHMEDCTVSSRIVSIGSQDALNEILRQGAQQMLSQAIENEVV